MKRVAWLLSFLLITSTMVAATAPAASQGEAQRRAGGKFPRYPLWLARLLAPLGVAGAQALAGFQAFAYDPCKGGNWLLSAAQQHHPFGEWQLIGYYLMRNEEEYKFENLEKIFLWHLHYQTHFPNDGDLSHTVALDILKLTIEQESAIREKFKTWTPADERPFEPASCPSDKYAPK